MTQKNKPLDEQKINLKYPDVKGGGSFSSRKQKKKRKDIANIIEDYGDLLLTCMQDFLPTTWKAYKLNKRVGWIWNLNKIQRGEQIVVHDEDG